MAYVYEGARKIVLSQHASRDVNDLYYRTTR